MLRLHRGGALLVGARPENKNHLNHQMFDEAVVIISEISGKDVCEVKCSVFTFVEFDSSLDSFRASGLETFH
jgi:hypothetical protein